MKKLSLLFVLLAITSCSKDDENNTENQVSQQPGVYTHAGSGKKGLKDGTGSTADFNDPNGLAIDATGNVYVADYSNNVIRKITPKGEVSIFAGTGTGGSTNGASTSASFNNPTAVAIDGSGNLYVADYGNHKIRKITVSGVVSTLAGSGTKGSADGTDIGASFNAPKGIAVDASGAIYVADSDNNKIRKITALGVVTTFAGSGISGMQDGTGFSASFKTPVGLAIDKEGNLYVTDSNQKIRKITPAGVVTTLAGSGNTGSTNGSSTKASFNQPEGIAVDPKGNVYVADTNNNLIRKISPTGEVSTLAGSGNQGNADGSYTTASFGAPRGLIIDTSGNIYIGDSENHRIRKIVF